tara:strand:+ start:50 stop:1768 length:1719 start_codon:yes stop_codon:yes gene_type:complete
MSKYSRRAEKEKRDRLREEWEATQEQKENEAIDVEDLKQQDDMEKGKYLKMSILGDLNIDPKKHKAQQKQKKIRTIAEEGATEGERSAGQGKLKDQTQLPNLYQMGEGTPLQKQDAIDNQEFDRALNPDGTFKKPTVEQLKKGVKIRKQDALDAANQLTEFAQDWRAFKAGAAAGALIPDGPVMVGGELIGGLGAVALRRLGAETIIKPAIRQIKKEAFDFAKRILPNGYQAKYAMATADDLGQVVPGNISRPLPGSKHVSGIVPQISGKFNKKVFTKTTLDPDLDIPWNLVNNPQEKGRKIAGSFVDQASDPKKWNELNNAIKAKMEKLYPGWDIPVKRKSIGGWAGHHTAPVKQMAWSVNGLSNEARDEAANYMAERIGQRLGYSPENLKAIPVEFHKYIHRLLNDALGTYDISKVEKAMGLKPGGFSKLELWDRKKGFDMITDNINQSKNDIRTFMKALAEQSKLTDVSPEVLADSMEDLLELQSRIRLGPGDPTLNEIMNKYLGRSQKALDFVEDEIPAAERPIKNILYRLALEDLDKAKKFAKARRGTTPGNLGRTDYNLPDSKGLE